MNRNKKNLCKSIVWKYFSRKNKTSANCTLCTKVIKHGGNTTNLMQHLQRKHLCHVHDDLSLLPNRNIENNIDDNVDENLESINEIDENIDENNVNKNVNINLKDKQPNSKTNIMEINTRKRITEEESSSTLSVSSCRIKHKLSRKCERIDNVFQRVNSFKDGGAMACNITNSIIFMIVKDNLPISLVENEGFKQLMKTVAPLYNIPCRKTITKLLDAKYDIFKNKFITNIEHISTFTLTCDIWTDISNKSYLGVTVHYLKTEIIFAKGVIGVIPLEQNHTSEYIKDKLSTVLIEFKISHSKIVAIVTDSAPNITNAINNMFNTKKHIPCMAHILAHVVPDSLKQTLVIANTITKLKNIVTLVKRSVVVTDELVRLQKRDGRTDGTILKFKQDVPTRWNSMFYMIERFLYLREYVYPITLKCPTCPEMITYQEFDILQDVISILKPIESVTKEIGGDLYPTSSIIIPIIRCMTRKIQDYIPTTDEGRNFKRHILAEIERRFYDIERYQLLAISTILDPRFKKIHFQRPLHVSSAINHINNLMQTTLNENTSVVSSVNKLDDVEIKEGDLWDFHDNLVASSTNSYNETDEINYELRQYLNQPVISRCVNPLKHWQSLKEAYPTLYKIAKQYLSIVATSVPSERLFSKAGLIKCERRNRLDAKRLNVLLFLQSLEYEDWNIM